MVADPFFEASLRIGRQLADSAIRHDGQCTWVDEVIQRRNDSTHRRATVLDGAFATGTTGIAWFLAQLGTRAEEPTLISAARGAVVRGLRLRQCSVGAATVLGTWLDDPELAAPDARAPEALTSLLRGVAATLDSAVTDFDATADDVALLRVQSVANDACDADAECVGVSSDSVGLLCGISGLAMSLAAWGARARQPWYVQQAVRKSRRERAFLQPMIGWYGDAVDHASSIPTVRRSLASGAAGIAVARFGLYRLQQDAALLAEGAAALDVLRQPRAPGEAMDASLLFGASGEIEALLAAYVATGEPSHLDAARHRGVQLLRTYRHVGTYDCGLGAGIETPALATGLAGIGLALLRLSDPVTVRGPIGSLP